MALERILALCLCGLGIAGSFAVWGALPAALLLAGLAWLPGRVLASMAGASPVVCGPGGISLHVALSLALMIPAVAPFFALGTSFELAARAYGAFLALTGVMAALYRPVRVVSQVDLRKDWAAALIVVAALLPAVLHYAGATVDDWWDLAFVRGYVEASSLSAAEPMLGTGHAHPRFVWNSWLLLQAFVLEGRMHCAVAFQASVLAAFACVVVVSGQVLLATALFTERRREARLAAILAIPFWLYGTEALPFFTRLYQDKFFAGLALMPVLIGLGVEYMRSGDRRILFCAAAAAAALCGVHSLMFGIALIGLVAVSAAVALARGASVRTRAAALAAVAMPPLAFPLMQAWSLRDRFGAQGIALEFADNPVVRAHLSLERLLWPQSAHYVVHPGAVFGVIALVAAIGWLRSLRRRDDLGAAVLVGLSALPVFLLFTPWVAGALGSALVPWLIYRVGWLVPVPHLIGALFDRPSVNVGWSRRTIAVGLVGSLLLAAVVPTALDRVRRDMREHPGPREGGPRSTTLALYEFLEALPERGVVMAPRGISGLVPALTGHAVVAQSERATLVFSPDAASAYARLRDQATFFLRDTLPDTRAEIARTHAVTLAVFRRRWITRGSEARWLGRSGGRGFVALQQTAGVQTWAADTDVVAQALPADAAAVVYSNEDFLVVRLALEGSGAGVDKASATEVARVHRWLAAFGVLDRSETVAGEVVAALPHYPGAYFATDPVPLSLGMVEFPVWVSGGEQWEDAPYDVRVTVRVPGGCRVDGVVLVPHLPTGRREIFDIEIEDQRRRYRARADQPLGVALEPRRREVVEIRIASALGAAFGIAELRLMGSRDDCESPWTAPGESIWNGAAARTALPMSAWIELARAYPAQGIAALARILASEGKDADALAVYGLASATVPTSATVWIEQGLLHDAASRFDRASHCYRQALRGDSNSAWARGCVAWADLRRGHATAALWQAWRAAALDDGYADAYTIMGMAWKDLGWKTGAQAALNDAIALDRYRSWGYLEKARLLAEQGELERAIAVLEEFLRLVPTDEDALALREYLQVTPGN